MTVHQTFYEEQAARALERLALLRERGAAPGEDERQLVSEVLEELSIALHELQVTTQELREQNEALLSAEGTIASERARYAELYNFAPDGYLVTDRHGMIHEANRVAEELLGAGRGALIDRPLTEYVPLRQRSAIRTLCNTMLHDGDAGVGTLDTVLRRTDKTLFPVALRVIVARRGQIGDPELRWTVRDASEQRSARQALAAEARQRKLAEASQRRSEAMYRHFVEHATDMVYELNEGGHFTFCNDQAARRMLGYSERELLGRPLTDFVRTDRRKSMRAFNSALSRQHGKHSYVEFSMLAKDGREVWVGQNSATAALAGRGPTVQAVCRDITSQVQRVDQLERAGERMRDLSTHLQTQIEAERARISREIHDELGAALTVVRMELAVPTEGISDDKRNASLLRRIDAAIESVRRICSDLRPSLLDNMGLGAAIEWLAQEVHERRQVRCQVTLEGIPAELEPERATALFRIVQEAVTNVIRHAKASQLAIRQRTRGAEIVIEITDNGRGIKPEEQSAHHAYGIAGMHERAKAFGGRVRVSGGPKGTRVIVHMPASSPPGGGVDHNARREA